MKIYRISFVHDLHDALDEGRLEHEGSVYLVDKNNDSFWVVSEGTSALAVELFGSGTLVAERRCTLTKWCTTQPYDIGIVAEEHDVKTPALLCEHCEPVDEEDESITEVACRTPVPFDINVVKGGGLPPAWPSGRTPSRKSGRWKVLIHHMMRGDMYTFGAALLLDSDFSILIIRPASSLDSVKFPDHTGRHRAWFEAMLGAENYASGVQSRYTQEKHCAEWTALKKRHQELTDEYWDERTKHLTKLEQADKTYKAKVREEQRGVPHGQRHVFNAWKETEFQNLQKWKDAERRSYALATNARLRERRNLNVPEDVDRYHYKSIVKEMGRGYNFPGTVTNYVGARFADDSKGARRRVRDAFVKVSSTNAAKIANYVKKNLGGITRLARQDVCVIFFVRNVRPRGEEDKDWNLNRDAYWDLQSLFARSLRPKNGKLRVVAAGDAIALACRPDADNLVQIWNREPFDTHYEHAAFPDMRLQFALYDYLLQNSKCRFVVVGMRSGMLEPLAILGFPVVYLEKRKDDMGRNLRMRQWNGRIPYFATYIEKFPREAKFSAQDLVGIRRRMLEALAYGSDDTDIADESYVDSRVGRTVLLLHEGRFATYEVLYYEGAKPKHGPFMAVASALGEDHVESSDAHALRDLVAKFVVGEGKPKKVAAKALAEYVSSHGHTLYDSGPDFDEDCEQAMLHALACHLERMIVTYVSKDKGNILVPDMVHHPSSTAPILLYYDDESGYCLLVPAATRRSLDPIIEEDDEDDELSSGGYSDDEDMGVEEELDHEPVRCDICGAGSDIVDSQCTKQGVGCTGAFYMGRRSDCQQRYFLERNGSGDGRNRCRVCLIADGVDPLRLSGVGPCL